MQDTETQAPAKSGRPPWNKGKLIGAKPPLRPKHVWSIRTKLQNADRKRDLAILDLQERQGVGDRAPEAGVAKQALGPVVRRIRRFAIRNNGSRSQSAARTMPMGCPCRERCRARQGRLRLSLLVALAAGRTLGAAQASGRNLRRFHRVFPSRHA